jgi:hypothetical protein
MPQSKRHKNILVCGIPGSGKTKYCEWLEREKGFLHLDVDKLSDGKGTPTKLALFGLLNRDIGAFISEVSKRDGSVVIDWGFPMTSLPIVQLLRKLGFEVWWFDGDRLAAEQAFTNRGTVSLEAFRIQMKSIEACWTQVEKLAGRRIIKAVSAGPAHAPPECLFEEMLR